MRVISTLPPAIRVFNPNAVSELTTPAGEDLAGVSLMDLAEMDIDHSQTLLGNRFLCVGGGMLFGGPSGIGKSSALAQMATRWACNRDAFGIRPSRFLKIVIVQAENDQGDMIEMARGVLPENLGESDKTTLRNNTPVLQYRGEGGEPFLSYLRRVLEKHRPDILIIDPLMAFCGCAPTDEERIPKFLRGGLNPLMDEFPCATLVNHHTPKTNSRNTSEYKPSDWMYTLAGCADITNWTRGQIVIEPTHDVRSFRFHAAKRGGRLGWESADGSATTTKVFVHSVKKDEIRWYPATLDDVKRIDESRPVKGKMKIEAPSAERVLDFLPIDGSALKTELLTKLRTELLLTFRGADDLLTQAEFKGIVHPHKVPNPNGCKSFAAIGRNPQELFGVPKEKNRKRK